MSVDMTPVEGKDLDKPAVRVKATTESGLTVHEKLLCPLCCGEVRIHVWGLNSIRMDCECGRSFRVMSNGDCVNWHKS